ncbi:eukaryotic translation initiation factor eIF-1A [Perkinsela sp. CCAP 1560/4]|nr:eukaryotic translation initiation factor eIF-1A [Perkinsela sp. CCAP 1560/4]KNH08271.1 eukaryotic translation initiation factor eIF-1A [Perkinsela sp. CCAP 1560/4]|eukprot:KNH06965.1 eukaryotic translation initiation factor eIF-1A [Perkinsela sp. CCAP 1560/4]
MPKNTGMGGKNRKKGAKGKGQGTKRELITREDGQEYGICTAMLGCNRIKVHLFSGMDVIGVIRGKIVRRMWINLGNVVLCGNREFQSGSPKVDVILRYTPDETNELQRIGQIPDISRWSVVGRGGMVEEAEDGISGNIKFTSHGAKKEVKKKISDGWEISSDSEGDMGEEEGEEYMSDSAESEIEPDVEVIKKFDRHGKKMQGKHTDYAKTQISKAKSSGREVPPQIARSMGSLSIDEAEIDDI